MGLVFNAVDVETASREPWSICQIGIATFYNGSIIDTWSSLINPNTPFERYNIRVHGIRPQDVVGHPTFCDVHDELKNRLEDTVVVSHTLFDLNTFQKSWEYFNINSFPFIWLDSCKIARNAWAETRKGESFGLKPLANWLGISFKHHDALEDAIVSGKITVAACSEMNLTLDQVARMEM